MNPQITFKVSRVSGKLKYMYGDSLDILLDDVVIGSIIKKCEQDSHIHHAIQLRVKDDSKKLKHRISTLNFKFDSSESAQSYLKTSFIGIINKIDLYTGSPHNATGKGLSTQERMDRAEQLKQNIKQLVEQGQTVPQIAEQCNISANHTRKVIRDILSKRCFQCEKSMRVLFKKGDCSVNDKSVSYQFDGDGVCITCLNKYLYRL